MAGEPVLPEPPPDDAIPVNNPEPDAGGGGGADVDDEEEGVDGAVAGEAHVDDEMDVEVEEAGGGPSGGVGGGVGGGVVSGLDMNPGGGGGGGAGGGGGGAGGGGGGGDSGGALAIIGAPGGAAAEAAAFAAAAAAAAAPPTPAPWTYQGTLQGHTDLVFCLVTHPTIEHLAASGGKDAAIVLWDHERGEAVRKLKVAHEVMALAYGLGASAGRLYAAVDCPTAASGAAIGHGQLNAWDTEAGHCAYVVPQPRGHVSCVHCAPDGNALLLGAADGSVRTLPSR